MYPMREPVLTSQDYPHVKQEAVSNLLRAKQYIIPSKYRAPHNVVACCG
jgi:hypothetical protein